jgi:tetratricopeptide (TPR) repeat protein
MTRYVAFLSYSHRDRRETQWLHRALEHYRIPKKLVGTVTREGPVPARLIPVFRDRDELAAADGLGEQLRGALEASGRLIVIASPASARSKWVAEEVRQYKVFHGEGRVLALIVGGEPYASGMNGREAEEAFPAPLRFRLAADGTLSDRPAEPIAADIRPGKDGKRLALLKLVAGITGLRLDDLVQREAQRRARRLTAVAVATSVGMLATSALAFYANQQRLVAVEQRRIAERETAAARAATNYLIGTFELSNPATENPRTVSLVTILERSAARAREELGAQPEIEAQLVAAVGRAYNNLGLLEEAEVAVARALPAIKRAGPDGVEAMVTLADARSTRGDLDGAMKTLEGAELMLGPDPKAHPALRASVFRMRGRIKTAQSRMDAALQDYDAALAALAHDPAPDPEVRAEILNNRGILLSDLGRFDDAERSLREAGALFTRYRGPRHLLTGQNWYALAQNAFLAGRLDLAERRIATSIGILSRMLDRENPIRADALSMKGQIHQGQGRLAEADAALGEAVNVYRETVGERHYLIGIAEVYRGLIASDRGRTAEALAHLDEAKRNYDASYGGEHANHGDLLVNRAVILDKAGRTREAVPHCRDGLAILDRQLGAAHSFTRDLRRTCVAIGARAGVGMT